MKKQLFAAALCAALLCSCNKQITTPTPLGQTAKITFSVNSGATKAVAELDDEKAVDSLQVYVFNAAGTRLEAYGSSAGASLSLSVTLGSKTIAALVNHPSLTGVTTLQALKATVSDLGDNSTSSFVMFGSLSETISTASSNIVVPVSRLVARVVLSKVTNNISLPQYANTPLVVRGIYLINAAGECNLEHNLTPIKYYNKGSNASSELPELLSKTPNASLAVGQSYSTENRFYCYPNPVTTDNSSQPWSPRFTRLVVDTSLGYYPITLQNAVQANTSYEISELVVTKPGVEVPDVKIETDIASFTIQVLPWSSVEMGPVTI